MFQERDDKGGHPRTKQKLEEDAQNVPGIAKSADRSSPGERQESWEDSKELRVVTTQRRHASQCGEPAIVSKQSHEGGARTHAGSAEPHAAAGGQGHVKGGSGV